MAYYAGGDFGYQLWNLYSASVASHTCTSGAVSSNNKTKQ